tara:strand:- start:1238 stop:1990 length:753 start_codon:yes stop_codon:yes gene_type:complete
MIYFHKIVPLIISPLFFIIFLILLGIFFKSKKLTLSGLSILILCSLPVISNKLINYLEKDYHLQNIDSVNKADAIVVLSGMLRTIKNDGEYKYEFNENVDRIFAGINLYKNNKANKLILTRGKLPWNLGKSEGEYLKDFSIKNGISENDIILTDIVKNTEAEAKSIKKLLDKNDKIILVTSAFHMPRAKKIFEANGINTMPFAVDFRSKFSKTTFLNFIPSAGSFGSTSYFVKEMMGRAYYNIKINFTQN